MRPRVLVVDDESTVLCSLQRQAHTVADVAVTLMADPRAAVHAALNEMFDVVVADQAMPFICGTSLLEQVAARKPYVALVLMVGVDDRRIAERVAAIGIDVVVLKPVRAGDLWRAIELAIRKRGEASRLAALARAAATFATDRPGIPCWRCPLPVDLLNTLTPHQHDVIDALYAGERVKCIAVRKGCSESTVRDHASAAYRKAGLRAGHGWSELIRRYPWAGAPMLSRRIPTDRGME